MTMAAPCDANQAKKILRKSLDYPGPIYIRIPRGEEPLFMQMTMTTIMRLVKLLN